MLSEIDKLDPFIDMHYQYVQTDLTKSGSEGGYRVSKIPAKLCEEKDLGLSKEEAEEMLAAWSSATLVCPNYDGIGEVLIKGDTSSLKTKSLHFVIQKCSLGDDCVEQSEFNSFIEDFEVSAYGIYEQINYEEYGNKPVFKTQTLLGQFLLKSFLVSETINNNLYLR